ncbi:CHCH domain-containing protein [Lineolata rhizophorae]|uniref:CHCH domain-containing protein n=1 Tax=Lineolata rhizophorae TaxID=578093 RepID=A0A6A6NNH2_9PEZI|nr:CHCH domain-containing protein [Lineolata rhizophorae]
MSAKLDWHATMNTEPADEEPDDWDKRIFSTGCADENARLTDCYYEKKDWRACKHEMEAFRECWKRKGNDKRVETKEA